MIKNPLKYLIDQLTKKIEVPQYKVPLSISQTITTLNGFMTALDGVGNHYVEINPTVRSNLLAIGLIPVNEVGKLEARKMDANNFFLTYTTYSNKQWIASISSGTLSGWVSPTNVTTIAQQSGAGAMNFYDSTVVDSAYEYNSFYAHQSGKIVACGGSFRALTNISASGIQIATGLPKSVSSTDSSFLARGNDGNTYKLAVGNNGKLMTAYSGNIPAGTAVSWSGTYIAN